MPAKARGGNSGVAATALLTSVLAMPHERQVALLSDALLREYMHRRGFLATLKAFDGEHPRDADTIASRALMADLLALREQDMQRLKPQNNSSSSNNNDNDADKNDNGASSSRAWTMMELLCALRVERQREVQRLRAAAAALIVPTVPEHYKQLIAAAEQQQQQQQQQQQASPRGDDDNSNTDRTTSSEAAAVTTTQQRVRRSHHRRRRHDNDDGRLLRRSGRALTTALLDDAAATGMTMDELLGGSDDDDNNKGERDTKATATRGRDDNDGRAGKQPAAAAAVLSGSKDSNNERNDDEGLDSGSDDEDVCLDGAVPLTVAEADELCVLLCGDNNNKGSSSYNDDADRGDNATASTAALPPLSFVQQGFVFDDACECALVQLRRGCDAVLAVVQAHVAAIYHEKQLYADVATRQRVCLQRALATMLLRAQPDVARVVLVDGGRNNNNNDKSSGEEAKSGKGVASASPHTSRRANAQTALTPQQVVRRMRRGRFRVARGFASRDDLDAALARLLQAHWMATPRGCGLWCVLLSLVLSRGMSAVRADMTGATATAAVAASPVRALIDVARGVGTMALINLCLAGSAVCYTHDGTLRRLPGYAAKLTCGILCGDEDVDDDGDGSRSRSSGASRSVYGEAWCARRAVARDRATATTTSATSTEVTYTRATEPQHASWVVCHGERVVNVFMRKDVRRVVAQKRELGGAASAELLYWDAATDDDVRTLLVTVGSGGSGSAARRSVLPPPPPFLRNALRSVPLWRHATVEWADE